MEKTINQIVEIQKSLKDLGYSTYASLLAPYVKKNENREKRVIGFVGDNLVGKSTVINSVIGRNVLPTDVIPTDTEIIVKAGDSDAVFLRNSEKVALDNLKKLREEESILVEIESPFLRENTLEFMELHGLITAKKINDISFMADLYKCDAVVLVMSAERLFSETECRFIDNYIENVGAEHLILIVNKMSSIDESDFGCVLEYIETQVSTKFPQVKWILAENDLAAVNGYPEHTKEYLRKLLLTISGEKKGINWKPVENMLRYIVTSLEKDYAEIGAAIERSEAETKKHNEQILQKKAMEEVAIEEAVISFKQRRNDSVEKIDAFIKRQFEEISIDIMAKFDAATNKLVWYESELEACWKKNVRNISEKTDQYVLEVFQDDISWLNNVIKTKLSMEEVKIEIPNHEIIYGGNTRPYGEYKKYVPIGIGGGTVIGFCLFKTIGVVIGFGSGVLVYSFLEAKQNTQNEEIKKSIQSGIREIASKVRGLSREEVEKTYSNTLLEFEKEAESIISSKYVLTVQSNETERKIRMEKLVELIADIKEEQSDAYN